MSSPATDPALAPRISAFVRRWRFHLLLAVCAALFMGILRDWRAKEETLALHTAAYRGDVDRVRTMLPHRGLDPDAKGPYGWTAMHWAAGLGHTGVVRCLLEAGGEVNVATEKGGSIVFSRKVRPADLSRFIQAPLYDGPSWDQVQPGHPGGATPLELAAVRGHRETVLVLLAAGARTESWDPKRGKVTGPARRHKPDWYIPAMAEQVGQRETAEMIRQWEAGQSLLGAAFRGASAEYIRLLVEHGAVLEDRDYERKTPLIRAVTQKHPEATEELLRLGADPGLRDEKGKNALDYAREAFQGSGSERARRVLRAVEAAWKERRKAIAPGGDSSSLDALPHDRRDGSNQAIGS